MDASILINFLEGKEKSSFFKKTIAEETYKFKQQLKKLGASVPTMVTGYDSINKFSVEQQHIKRICEEYLNGCLDEYEIEYITSALELQECFVPVSEKIEYSIFLLAEPVCNGSIDKEKVQEIMDLLNN